MERRLLEHDPLFTSEHTHERSTFRKQRLLNAWLRGMAPDDPMSSYDPEDLEQNSRLHLNVERVRVPEPLYQPLMAGVDQAGILEVMQYVLREFGPDEQRRLTKVSLSLLSVVRCPETLRACENASLPAWRPASPWRPSTQLADHGAILEADQVFLLSCVSPHRTSS